MNKTLKYLNTAALLSASIKDGSKVVIMSGLKEHEFNLEIVKNDPFIQHMLSNKANKADMPEISRDNMEQASWMVTSNKRA